MPRVKFRVTLSIYTHECPDDPEVLEQLHIPQQTDVTVSTRPGLLIVEGPKDELSEILFFYHDRDLEGAAYEMMYGAEVLT
jgi:hypothetical protein